MEAKGQRVTVPYGSFTECLQTGEFNPIEPESLSSLDHKFYAPGIGFVLEIKGNGQRHERIAIETE